MYTMKKGIIFVFLFFVINSCFWWSFSRKKEQGMRNRLLKCKNVIDVVVKKNKKCGLNKG